MRHGSANRVTLHLHFAAFRDLPAEIIEITLRAGLRTEVLH